MASSLAIGILQKSERATAVAHLQTPNRRKGFTESRKTDRRAGQTPLLNAVFTTAQRRVLVIDACSDFSPIGNPKFLVAERRPRRSRGFQAPRPGSRKELRRSATIQNSRASFDDCWIGRAGTPCAPLLG